MTASGHKDPFPWPSPNDRCRLRQQSLLLIDEVGSQGGPLANVALVSGFGDRKSFRPWKEGQSRERSLGLNQKLEKVLIAGSLPHTRHKYMICLPAFRATKMKPYPT